MKYIYEVKSIDKEIHSFSNEWDYLGWKNLTDTKTKYTQPDWDATLITKVNQISSEINNTTLRGGGTKIIVPLTLKSMIESSDYYHDNTLAGRYSVEFTDKLIDEIKVLRGFMESELRVIDGVESMIIMEKDGDEIYAKFVPIKDNIDLITKNVSDSRGVIKIINHTTNK